MHSATPEQDADPSARDPPSPAQPSRTRTSVQLPPIRTVLGAQLSLPAPSSHSPPSAYSPWARDETRPHSGHSPASSHSGNSNERERIIPGSSSQPPSASASSSSSSSTHSAAPHVAALPPHALFSLPPHTSPPFPHPSTRHTPHVPPALAPTWHPLPFPPPPRSTPPSGPSGSGASLFWQPPRSPFSPHITLPQPTYSGLVPFPPGPATSPYSAPFPPPPPPPLATTPHTTPHTAPPSAPPYLHILRPSPSGQLITGPPISRVRSRSGTSAAAEDGAAGRGAHGDDTVNPRRHVCPLCGKKFNRPSSLKTHLSVHTGFQPFECPHKGCSKRFSVASNMRRHLRKHKPSHSDLHSDAGSHAGPHASSSSHSYEYPRSSVHFPERAQESPSLGSSEGDGEADNLMDVEMEEEQSQPQTSASASASSSGGLASPAVAAPSASAPILPAAPPLPAPATYFEWTAAAARDVEDVYSIEARGGGGTGSRGVSGPARPRFWSGSGSGSRGGGRRDDRHPRHASR